MQIKCLISNYYFQMHNFQNIHSVGPEIYFYNPCIGYVKSGYAKFLYKGQTLYAYEGDLIYIPHGTKYHSVWFGSPDIQWYSINFTFKSQYDFLEYQFQILKNYPSELFDKMNETYDNLYLLSVSYFYQLLNDVFKKLKITAMPATHISIEPAMEYIENRYNEKISISELAKLCSCSESAFYKLFKKTTGVTPIEYKHNIMIQHALNLLSHTTLSIEEISTSVGFTSANYFRKVFIKLTDKTPKELRQKETIVQNTKY